MHGSSLFVCAYLFISGLFFGGFFFFFFFLSFRCNEEYRVHLKAAKEVNIGRNLGIDEADVILNNGDNGGNNFRKLLSVFKLPMKVYGSLPNTKDAFVDMYSLTSTRYGYSVPLYLYAGSRS